MNEHEEIELAKRREQVKPKGAYPKHIDLTIEEDLQQVEDYKDEEEDDPYERAYQESYQHDQYQQGYYHEDEQMNMIEKDFPSIPAKIIVLTITFLTLGIGLIVAGIFSYIYHTGAPQIIVFMLVGILVTSPGCIYCLFLIQAANAITPEEKEEILNQIPY